MTQFLHITLIVILCLSLAGSGIVQDLCDDFSSQEDQLMGSYDSGGVNSSSEAHDCECYLHHNHLELTFFDTSNNKISLIKKRPSFDYFIPPSYKANSPERPPKIIS